MEVLLISENRFAFILVKRIFRIKEKRSILLTMWIVNAPALKSQLFLLI